MADLFWLGMVLVRRIVPHFPLSHGVPRVDDQRVVTGFAISSATGCADTAPQPSTVRNKILYNRAFAVLAERW